MGNVFKKIFSSKSKILKQNSKILMLGLDNAGKTTILYNLKLGKVINTIPTIGFNVQQLDYDKINFLVWDVGGQQKLRNLWLHYYQNCNGLIYIIDSSDKQRMQLASQQFTRIISHQLMQQSVVLILANKRDIAIMSIQQICEKLKLKNIKRNWAIFPVTAIKQQGKKGENNGLIEAMEWLVENINYVKQPKIKKVKLGGI